ncbi:glycosyltransferase family 2 protein [Weissella cibaria]|uniref:glycosyltransferase family 2 protein n=1 Tax=Weissella cibaria TaxID=137591 RepID=UPI000FFE247C|nr:glycosyltransferase family A protein [Weissella cibaria]QAT26268.1 glycosyltransferase family 2 protein [Weissella cibaria]
MEDKVSVIVPIYNVDQWLDKCLKSIIRQQYSNLEIILVDDGSTDNSPLIIEKYADLDERIIVLRKENGGLSDSRNLGLEKSDGDFILFVDGDDWLENNAVSTLMEVQKSAKVDLVLFPYKRIYATQTILAELMDEEEKYLDGNDWLRLYRRMIGPIGKEVGQLEKLDRLSTAWGKLYRRTILMHDFKHYEENYPEDLFFNVQNLENVKSAFYTEKTFYCYNKMNDKSVTKGNKLIYRYDKSNSLMDLMDKKFKNNPELYAAYENRALLRTFAFSLNVVESELDNESKKQIIHRISTDVSKYVDISNMELDLRNMPLPWRLFFFLLISKKINMLYSYISLVSFIKIKVRS